MINNIFNNPYTNFQPLPPDYTGWNSNSSIFFDLINEYKPTSIIEVGSWKGASAIKMAEAANNLKLNTKIYCVDTWLGALEFWTYLNNTEERNLKLKNNYPTVYYQFLSNIDHSGHTERIVPIPNTSNISAKILEYYKITSQIIYIDGSHEYDDVKADLKNYWNLLTDGGVMFGDDYYAFPGVNNAVNEFALEINRKIEIVSGNFWVIKK